MILEKAIYGRCIEGVHVYGKGQPFYWSPRHSAMTDKVLSQQELKWLIHPILRMDGSAQPDGRGWTMAIDQSLSIDGELGQHQKANKWISVRLGIGPIKALCFDGLESRWNRYKCWLIGEDGNAWDRHCVACDKQIYPYAWRVPGTRPDHHVIDSADLDSIRVEMERGHRHLHQFFLASGMARAAKTKDFGVDYYRVDSLDFEWIPDVRQEFWP